MRSLKKDAMLPAMGKNELNMIYIPYSEHMVNIWYRKSYCELMVRPNKKMMCFRLSGHMLKKIRDYEKYRISTYCRMMAL